MKKIVALFALVMTVGMVYATTFTVDDYKAGFATVPVFYKGSVSLSNGYIDLCCAVRKVKGSVPAYLAICQPCLDCYYNCRLVDGTDFNDKYTNPNGLEPKGVYGFMYYILDVDKKNKDVYYLVVPFDTKGELADANALYFNYNYQMAKKEVALWQTAAVADEPFFALVGVKDSKTWTFGKGKGKLSLKASIAKTFDGIASYTTAAAGNAQPAAWVDDISCSYTYFFNGAVKLTRDDSVTKKLMAEMISGICGNIPCEDFIEGAFGDYVLNKSYKKYDWWDVATFTEDYFGLTSSSELE